MLESKFEWREASWTNRFAYIFNRTALGLATIAGLWNLYQGDLWGAFLVFGVLLPIYLALPVWFDAP